MKKFNVIVVVLLWLVLIASVSAKDLYRWQDEKGQWHFGDSANASLKSNVEVVHTAPETTNVIKIKKTKTVGKKTITTVTQTRRRASSAKNNQQQQCDKLRDSLRFKAFRYEERDYYDHECINKVKW